MTDQELATRLAADMHRQAAGVASRLRRLADRVDAEGNTFTRPDENGAHALAAAQIVQACTEESGVSPFLWQLVMDVAELRREVIG